jgi:hypothetical protein
MGDSNPALLIMGSIVALAVAARVTYLVFAYPGVPSVLLFLLVAPGCTIFGVGFFKIALDEFLKSKWVT